jgi:hypothetical protein
LSAALQFRRPDMATVANMPETLTPRGPGWLTADTTTDGVGLKVH